MKLMYRNFKPKYRLNSFVFFRLKNNECYLWKIIQMVFLENKFFYTLLWSPTKKDNNTIKFSAIEESQIEEELEMVLEVWDLIILREDETELLTSVKKRVIRDNNIFYTLEGDKEISHENEICKILRLGEKERKQFVKTEFKEEYVTKREFDKVFYSLT